MSRELGFQQSVLGATELYAFALLVWPLQSLTQTLFSPSFSLSAFVSVLLLQLAMPANEHQDRAIIQHGGKPRTPPFYTHTYTHSCCTRCHV